MGRDSTCPGEGAGWRGKGRGCTDPPEDAGEEVHAAEEDEEELDDPHPRRAHVQPLRQDAARGTAAGWAGERGWVASWRDGRLVAGSRAGSS